MRCAVWKRRGHHQTRRLHNSRVGNGRYVSIIEVRGESLDLFIDDPIIYLRSIVPETHVFHSTIWNLGCTDLKLYISSYKWPLHFLSSRKGLDFILLVNAGVSRVTILGSSNESFSPIYVSFRCQERWTNMIPESGFKSTRMMYARYFATLHLQYFWSLYLKV